MACILRRSDPRVAKPGETIIQVLGCNDTVIGVYSTPEKIDAAQEVYAAANPDQPLHFTQHLYIREFVLDAPARL